jgi:hypothetical protein
LYVQIIYVRERCEKEKGNSAAAREAFCASRHIEMSEMSHFDSNTYGCNEDPVDLFYELAAGDGGQLSM